jgi:hypothetical protein
MERWKEHFEDLLKNRKTTEKTAKEERKNKTEINEEINRDNRITFKRSTRSHKKYKKRKNNRTRWNHPRNDKTITGDIQESMG